MEGPGGTTPLGGWPDQGSWVDAPLWNGLILAGGPPRSGTTLLANLLNAHPRIAVAIDNSVQECWGLYDYGQRVGLVQRLRSETLSPAEAQSVLWHHLVGNGDVWGVAPSSSTLGYPKVPAPERRSAPKGMMTVLRRRFVRAVRPGQALSSELVRHRLPLEQFPSTLRLALKSPEIVFVLPELARAFPDSRFVLVFRPAVEVAESMYRKGFEWKLASFHRRWRQELDLEGRLLPPPGVPDEWHTLWRATSDLGRCAIYATSYLRAMALGLPEVDRSRRFVYSHATLRTEPASVLMALARFLGVGYDGFEPEAGAIRPAAPQLAPDLRAEVESVEQQVDTKVWSARVEAFLGDGGRT